MRGNTIKNKLKFIKYLKLSLVSISLATLAMTPFLIKNNSQTSNANVQNSQVKQESRSSQKAQPEISLFNQVTLEGLDYQVNTGEISYDYQLGDEMYVYTFGTKLTYSDASMYSGFFFDFGNEVKSSINFGENPNETEEKMAFIADDRPEEYDKGVALKFDVAYTVNKTTGEITLNSGQTATGTIDDTITITPGIKYPIYTTLGLNIAGHSQKAIYIYIGDITYYEPDKTAVEPYVTLEARPIQSSLPNDNTGTMDVSVTRETNDPEPDRPAGTIENVSASIAPKEGQPLPPTSTISLTPDGTNDLWTGTFTDLKPGKYEISTNYKWLKVNNVTEYNPVLRKPPPIERIIVTDPFAEPTLDLDAIIYSHSPDVGHDARIRVTATNTNIPGTGDITKVEYQVISENNSIIVQWTNLLSNGGSFEEIIGIDPTVNPKVKIKVRFYWDNGNGVSDIPSSTFSETPLLNLEVPLANPTFISNTETATDTTSPISDDGIIEVDFDIGGSVNSNYSSVTATLCDEFDVELKTLTVGSGLTKSTDNYKGQFTNLTAKKYKIKYSYTWDSGTTTAPTHTEELLTKIIRIDFNPWPDPEGSMTIVTDWDDYVPGTVDGGDIESTLTYQPSLANPANIQKMSATLYNIDDSVIVKTILDIQDINHNYTVNFTGNKPGEYIIMWDYQYYNEHNTLHGRKQTDPFTIQKPMWVEPIINETSIIDKKEIIFGATGSELATVTNEITITTPDNNIEKVEIKKIEDSTWEEIKTPISHFGDDYTYQKEYSRLGIGTHQYEYQITWSDGYQNDKLLVGTYSNIHTVIYGDPMLNEENLLLSPTKTSTAAATDGTIKTEIHNLTGAQQNVIEITAELLASNVVIQTEPLVGDNVNGYSCTFENLASGDYTVMISYVYNDGTNDISMDNDFSSATHVADGDKIDPGLPDVIEITTEQEVTNGDQNNGSIKVKITPGTQGATEGIYTTFKATLTKTDEPLLKDKELIFFHDGGEKFFYDLTPGNYEIKITYRWHDGTNFLDGADLHTAIPITLTTIWEDATIDDTNINAIPTHEQVADSNDGKITTELTYLDHNITKLNIKTTHEDGTFVEQKDLVPNNVYSVFHVFENMKLGEWTISVQYWWKNTPTDITEQTDAFISLVPITIKEAIDNPTAVIDEGTIDVNHNNIKTLEFDYGPPKAETVVNIEPQSISLGVYDNEGMEMFKIDHNLKDANDNPIDLMANQRMDFNSELNTLPYKNKLNHNTTYNVQIKMSVLDNATGEYVEIIADSQDITTQMFEGPQVIVSSQYSDDQEEIEINLSFDNKYNELYIKGELTVYYKNHPKNPQHINFNETTGLGRNRAAPSIMTHVIKVENLYPGEEIYNVELENISFQVEDDFTGGALILEGIITAAPTTTIPVMLGALEIPVPWILIGVGSGILLFLLIALIIGIWMHERTKKINTNETKILAEERRVLKKELQTLNKEYKESIKHLPKRLKPNEI